MKQIPFYKEVGLGYSYLLSFVAKVTQRVPLVEQEILTLPEHPSSLPVFSGVHVAQFLVFCVVFCRLLIALFLLTKCKTTMNFCLSTSVKQP